MVPNFRRPSVPAALLAAALAAAAVPARAEERTSAPPAASRVDRGLAFLEEGDAEKALKEFEGALKEEGHGAAVHAGIVRLHLSFGDLERAGEAVRAGLEKFPGDGPLLLLRARILLASGVHGSAADTAAEALKARPPLDGPGSAAAVRIRAEAILGLSAGDPVEADKEFAAALATRPDDADLLAAHAEFLVASGRPADGEPKARRAVEKVPDREEFRVLLVRVLLKAGKIPEAREAALAGADALPLSAPAAAAVGLTYEVSKEPAAALPHYARAAKLRPKRSEYAVSLGYCQARAGQWKDAEATLKAAADRNPRDFDARLHLGWVLNHQGKIAEALAVYEGALKLRPDHLRTLWNQADLLVLLGKQKEAEKAISRILALQPTHDEALRLRAQLAWKMGKAEEAEKVCGQVLAINPKNARALLLKAQIMAEFDDEETEKAFLAATEADPTFSWPWLYLAEYYDEVLSKPKDAVRAYRKYLELGGPDPDGTIRKAEEALAKETGL